MSTEVFAEYGLYVTRLAGPASEGDDRARWQITIPGEFVTLTRAEVRRLGVELHAASLERKKDERP